MQPSETFWKVFGMFGIFAVAGIVIIFMYTAFDALRDVVRQWRWQHRYKHRFDKPPTAACYCKDCKYHGTKYKDGSNACGLPGVDRYTPDDAFCYEAEPMTRKEAERRGKDG